MMADHFQIAPGPWSCERLAMMSDRHFSIKDQTGTWLATVSGEQNARAVWMLPAIVHGLEVIARGEATAEAMADFAVSILDQMRRAP